MKSLRNLKRSGNRKGFSLIELVIVIAIISVISVIAVPTVTQYIARSKTTSCTTIREEILANYKAEVAAEVLRKETMSLADYQKLLKAAIAETKADRNGEVSTSDTEGEGVISITTLCPDGGTVTCTLAANGDLEVKCSSHKDNPLTVAGGDTVAVADESNLTGGTRKDDPDTSGTGSTYDTTENGSHKEPQVSADIPANIGSIMQVFKDINVGDNVDSGAAVIPGKFAAQAEAKFQEMGLDLKELGMTTWVLINKVHLFWSPYDMTDVAVGTQVPVMYYINGMYSVVWAKVGQSSDGFKTISVSSITSLNYVEGTTQKSKDYETVRSEYNAYLNAHPLS